MSIPSTFGRYGVVAHLATGGMAQVFIARLEGPGHFQRTVAIKRVLPHLAADARFRDMFLDEARVTAAVRHPNVAEVYDLVSEGGEVYLVMEYVPGETVLRLYRSLRKASCVLPWHLAAHVVAQASAGLHAAHTLRLGSVPQPVIHRDVSPHNLLIGYDGDVKVIDFGIAKMRGQESRTQVGEVKGKFAYMSPEQACSRELDARSDLFSIGVVLWELLTGTRLFGRDDEVATLQAVLHDEVIPPSEIEPEVPSELDEVVLACLERDRDARIASADDLRARLEAILRDYGATGAREELSALMHAEFAERIATKDLLVHGALPVDRVPSLATPTVTEISVVSRNTMRADAAPKRRRRSSPWTWPAATALVISGAAAAWVGAVGLEKSRGPAAPVPVAPAPRIEALPPATSEAVAPEPAVLDIQTAPAGADIFLDGAFLGISPLRWSYDGPAREGTTTLRLTNYETTTVPVALSAGGFVEIARELEPVAADLAARRRARSSSRPAVVPPSEPAPAQPVQASAPDYFRFE
jgi:serine/threonine-protein kinase